MPYELTIQKATRQGDAVLLEYDDGSGNRILIQDLRTLARQEPDKDWLIAQAVRKWADSDPNFQSVSIITNKKITLTISVGAA